MAVAISSASTYCVISTRNPPPVAIRSRLIIPWNGSSLRGNNLIKVVQKPPRRLRGFELRAGIKKKSEEPVDSEFEVSLNLPPEDNVSQNLAVSLPLGLAWFEGLFLVGWIASLRGLIPGSLAFFGAADLVLSGIMVANYVGGWYALEQTRSEIDALNNKRETRNPNLPAVAPAWLDMGFSLAVSFIPFANLFLWLKFASRQKELPAKAKAALVANALIYEAPRLLAVLFLFSGGLFVLLQVGFVSNLAFLLSAIHRPLAEARVKNEKALMKMARVNKVMAKPKEILTVEEKERISRVKELGEFDMLLARRSSSPGTAILIAKAKEWTVGETMEWLGQQRLARYATTFAENNIDGELLLQLTNDELRDELHILSFGDRRKLEFLIQQLKER